MTTANPQGPAEQWLTEANTVTSNVASVLRGLVEAGENGVELALENLRPLAEQLDGLFADGHNPIPAPPSGGVPVDSPLPSDSEAAAQVRVVRR